MSESVSLVRYHVGRWLIHAGLRAMPPGRARSELFALLDQWATKVRQSLQEQAHD